MLDFARHLLRLDGGAGAQQAQEPATPAAGGEGGESPPLQQHLAEKRVSNRLIKEELGSVLGFPTFREGLTAIHKRNLAPFLL